MTITDPRERCFEALVKNPRCPMCRYEIKSASQVGSSHAWTQKKTGDVIHFLLCSKCEPNQDKKLIAQRLKDKPKQFKIKNGVYMQFKESEIPKSQIKNVDDLSPTEQATADWIESCQQIRNRYLDDPLSPSYALEKVENARHFIHLYPDLFGLPEMIGRGTPQGVISRWSEE